MRIPYVPAKHYKNITGKRAIDVIVFHDMEYPEVPDGAEWCAEYFHAPNSPIASAHYYVDNNSIVRGVWDNDVAYAAPGCNHNGIQIEHAGYARQSRKQWLDNYSRSELKLSAKLVAMLCDKYSIPVRHITAAGLKKEWQGITGHLDVTTAYRRSSHTDPGTNFPWPWYLTQVRIELRAIHEARVIRAKDGR